MISRASGNFCREIQSWVSRPVLWLSYAVTLDRGGDRMVSFEMYVSFLVMKMQFFKFGGGSLL